MEEINKIDIKQLCAKIILKKGLYIKVLSIVLVVSALWIFPQPRYYKCNIRLAPESASEGTIGSLGSLASSFGVNLGGMSSSDAIYPSIYPHVVSSNDFIIDLLIYAQGLFKWRVFDKSEFVINGPAIKFIEDK